jgi:periplasmic protein TonB
VLRALTTVSDAVAGLNANGISDGGRRLSGRVGAVSVRGPVRLAASHFISSRPNVQYRSAALSSVSALARTNEIAYAAAMADVSPKEPLFIWGLAALGAVAFHVAAVVVALAHMRPDADDVALGAPAIEVGLEFSAPRVEPSNLPPGPEAEDAAASPAVAAQKEVVKPSDLPNATPTETDDPDRVVTADDSKKPTEDPNVVATPAAPSEASAASVATAVPSPQLAQESQRSVAPAQGTGDSAQRIRATWQKELLAHFLKYLRYPSDRSQEQAEVAVSFELDRSGRVLSAHVVRGSGDASFDEAALVMIRRADPVPPPPPIVADDGLTFTIPIRFRAVGIKH